MKKRAIIAVTNDLTTDQRVDRVCNTLHKAGFEVVLIGRHRKDSLPLAPRPYKTHRMHLLFSKGPAFYAEHNFRLFLFMLFHKADLLISNDLDTLPGTRLASVIKKVAHVHDCHEYFRGMPELNGRPRVVKIWKWLEDWIFPRLKDVYAVNDSIAKIYSREYNIPVMTIRNVPFSKNINSEKAHLDEIEEGTAVILYQGAVNVDRGLEEAIMAMKYVKTQSKLLIIGTGDVLDNLKNLVKKEGLGQKVIFTGSIPFQDLHPYTLLGDIGLSIEKDVSLNYHYCLPNKFLDYIQARLPVLVTSLPEMKAIVEKYHIGEMIDHHDPVYLAEKFDSMLGDREKLNQYRVNAETAAKELCWENEERQLLRIFTKYA